VSSAEKDPFESFDAAYVLGSLSPADREAFEAHLAGCADCSESVAALAALPALLSQVTTTVEDEGLPPEGLLRSVLGRARRARRRKLGLTVGALIVAAGACGALAFSALSPGEAGSPAPSGTAMTALGGYPVKADAVLSDHDWGTSVTMSCIYGGAKAHDYVLVAVGRDGDTAELASWHAIPSNTARIVVGTGLRRGDIRALEIRSTAGQVLLRLTP
jgi:hypothetical protein